MKSARSRWAVEAYLQIRLLAMRFYVPDCSTLGSGIYSYDNHFNARQMALLNGITISF
ncbi:MAG: hypothetical protein LBT09_11210 [Planctomycetaceae bacterium]|nr:hypothetical protein [Planctomycetaceae bacterium]